MNRVIIILLFFNLIANCSLDTKTGLWSKKENIAEEKKQKEPLIREILGKTEIINEEFNKTYLIKFQSKPRLKSFINNFDNNNGRINYDGRLKSIERYRFSKIKNFDQFEPDLIFDKENIIFFNSKGTVLKFNNSSKLIWKKNVYTKREKKLKPVLFFGSSKKKLIVADSIAKYYALDISTGKLLWSKNHTSPFNSQIKISDDKFFVIDYQNVLRCFSIKDGKELWKVKTEKTLIKSQKKLSIIVLDEKVFFSNSIGDISAVDIKTGNLVWQIPTQKSTVYEDTFFLKNSDLISDGNSIFFSNNRNEFFSLDIKNGNFNWKQRINSNLRSTIVENFIFSVTVEGFLVVLNNIDGKIVRVTNIFDGFHKSKRVNRSRKNRVPMQPSGFIMGTNNLYITTDTGRMIIADIKSGKSQKILKLDKYKISRPFVLQKKMYIVKNGGILKLN